MEVSGGMNDKTLLFASHGFIAGKIQEALACDSSDRRILTFKDAEDEIKRHDPKVIINCIGSIGRNVDDCELDKDKTLMANTFVPVILAEIAVRYNIRLVHISSGCIYHFDYSKDTAINEERPPDFFDLFYSRAKIYSEQVLNILSDTHPVLIARLRVPLDNRPHNKNILTKLIGYKDSIVDIPNSVTYIPDFISGLRHLIGINARGVYNIVNKGALRYPELLDIYKKYSPDFEYKVIDYQKLNIVRTNLILSVQKLERSGFKVRDIHEVLEECVKEYVKYS